jgi:hypothetical protein
MGTDEPVANRDRFGASEVASANSASSVLNVFLKSSDQLGLILPSKLVFPDANYGPALGAEDPPSLLMELWRDKGD